MKYSNRGFSLIEVVVVTAISTILALGSASHIISLVKTQKTSQTSAEILYAKKIMEDAVRSRRPGATNPLAFRNCFNLAEEAKALSATGAPIVFTTLGYTYQAGQTVDMGGRKFLIQELSFGEARKIFTDATSSGYYGNIYMQAKNLATGFDGKRTLLTTVFMTVAPSPGAGCGVLNGINTDTMVLSEPVVCASLDGSFFNAATNRCENSAEPVADTNPAACLARKGFPLFQHDKNDVANNNFWCVIPGQVRCMNQNSPDPNISQNRMFRGFQFVASPPGPPVGAPVCDKYGIKARVIAHGTYSAFVPDPLPPAWVPPPVVTTNVPAYPTPARAPCQQMIDDDTNPDLLCGGVPSGAGATSVAAPDINVSVPSLPVVSPVVPVSYAVPSSCSCGVNPLTGASSSVANGQYCGMYFTGSLGYFENVTASSVFLCNNGSLEIVIEAGLPAEVQPPPPISPVAPTPAEIVEFSGYARGVNRGACNMGRCNYAIP